MATGTVDISLVEDRHGKVVMHKPDCYVVRAARKDGLPIATLYQCMSMPIDVPRHHCLEADRQD